MQDSKASSLNKKHGQADTQREKEMYCCCACCKGPVCEFIETRFWNRDPGVNPRWQYTNIMYKFKKVQAHGGVPLNGPLEK